MAFSRVLQKLQYLITRQAASLADFHYKESIDIGVNLEFSI